jgi:actin-related protein 10
MFGTYIPPLATLGATTIVPESERATRVPQEILTEELVEEIKTRCCFVSEVIPEFHEEDLDDRETTPEELMLEYMDSEPEAEEVPPSDDITPSESEFSTTESSENMTSQAGPSESPSLQEDPRASTPEESVASEDHLQGIANLYKRHSKAAAIRMRVTPPEHQQTGTGQGTLVIPGWIRERAAEVLFEGGDIDESSLAELILDVLLKTPMDLRKTLACSILVIGGTAMLPGFIPRLHAEILRCIQPPTPRNPKAPMIPGRPLPPVYDRYASLRSLVPYISILNNPSPPPPNSNRAAANAGKAPAFAPSLMAWVGGSLAGYEYNLIFPVFPFVNFFVYRSLKTGGAEISRERWDEADVAAQNTEQEDMNTIPDVPGPCNRSILPDWTRAPLPEGAPPANEKFLSTPIIVSRTPQATPIAARS